MGSRRAHSTVACVGYSSFGLGCSWVRPCRNVQLRAPVRRREKGWKPARKPGDECISCAGKTIKSSLQVKTTNYIYLRSRESRIRLWTPDVVIELLAQCLRLRSSQRRKIPMNWKTFRWGTIPYSSTANSRLRRKYRRLVAGTGNCQLAKNIILSFDSSTTETKCADLSCLPKLRRSTTTTFRTDLNLAVVLFTYE